MPVNETSDGREIIAINRIPPGTTIYPTGKGDALQSSGYRAGDSLIMDADNKVKNFRMMTNWYAIGGRVIWEGADLSDYMSAKLIAPATSHATNVTGDFNKYSLGGGANMFTPAAPGTGAWSLSLTEKHSGTNILKAVPVPSPTGTGYFDFDEQTNVLTANYSGTGWYNLFDFDVTMFQFASHIWGRAGDGNESSLEIPDVVGKLLLAQWRVEYTLTTSKTSGIKAGIIMVCAVGSNV